MRTIKFRAWHLDDGMLYFDFDTFQKDYHDQYGNIMQFTGLYDKNGKEIYEGDILKWKYPSLSSDTFKNIVQWDDTWACFGLFLPDSKFCKESDWFRVTDMEVIGNIYENSEYGK